MISERNILIWLNSLGLSNLTIANLRDYFSDITELWDLKRENLLNLKILSLEQVERIINNRNYNYLERLLFKLKQDNINLITIVDKIYPSSLYNIYNKPIVIYLKGEYIEEDSL